jgi:NitT/TauT family transport system permease protein
LIERRLWQIGAFVVVAAAWEAVGRAAHSLLLPTATATGLALARLITTGELWNALWLSNQAFLAGFLASLAAGVGCGLALARWTGIDRWLAVYIDLLLVVPKTALMPLVVIAFGFGLLSRSLVVFTFAFPVIVATVRAGAREVDQRLVGMARAFSATEAQVWRRVLLPGARPAVMTAVRLGLARAIAGMVSVELMLIAVGVGRLIASYRSSFDAASLYAVLLIVVIEAVLLIKLAGAFERRFGSWSGSETLDA